MQKYIDAHCHLLDAPNPDLAISNAQKKGVAAFVCAPATPTQWDDVVGLVNKFDCVFGVIGVHPWNVSELPQIYIDKLEKLLIKSPKLMVGEIGLDKNHPDMTRQTDVFIEQIVAWRASALCWLLGYRNTYIGRKQKYFTTIYIGAWL